MCLFNCIETVEKFLSSSEDIITCYKVLVVTYDRKLVSPFYANFKWKPGMVKSNSKLLNPNKHAKRAYNVRLGIHVFKTKKGANYFKQNFVERHASREYAVVVKVEAKKKDLLGANDYQFSFAEVSFSKEEYQKALKKVGPKCV